MKLIQSEKDIYIQETEIRPNTYASLVLLVCVTIVLTCELMTEIGVFKVGKAEMRIGSLITFLSSFIPLMLYVLVPKSRSNPAMKFFTVSASCIFSLSVGTFLTFHTTILMLFPILFAMLYRSRAVGVLAMVSSLFCTIFSPVLGYLLGTWDTLFFQELISISTNGTVLVEGAHAGLSLLNVGKILLYLVFPRILMVGSCVVLMFYIIRLGTAHVENQILLNRISQHDALTGLYNQNCFKGILANAEKDAAHCDERIAVLFFDANGLKAANDAKGHEFGDLLLNRGAESLRRICDDTSVYGFRVGGDEFVVLATGADGEAAGQLQERWREALREVNEENRKNPALKELVCDLACGGSEGRFADLERLVREADARMYQDKQRQKGLM